MEVEKNRLLLMKGNERHGKHQNDRKDGHQGAESH